MAVGLRSSPPEHIAHNADHAPIRRGIFGDRLAEALSTGFSPGQRTRATDSLTTATRSASPSSRKKRPARSGIVITRKYSALTLGQPPSGIKLMKSRPSGSTASRVRHEWRRGWKLPHL